jgi:hypothetical protein
MSVTTEEAERLAVLHEHDAIRFAPGMPGRELRQNTATAIRSLAAERDALQAHVAELRRLVQCLIDVVTVLDAWREEARAALEGKKDE